MVAKFQPRGASIAVTWGNVIARSGGAPMAATKRGAAEPRFL